MHRILATTALLLFLVAPHALAQETDATVDENGPADTEYAIPLQSAREEAAGGSGQDDATPLFGEGVETESASGADDNSSPATAKDDKTKPDKRKPRAPGKKDDTSDDEVPTVTLPTADASSDTSGGISMPAAIGGLTMAVLLLGAILGQIARRGRGRAN